MCIPSMHGDPVLIVDDNPANLKLLRVLLAAESYEVRTANSSEDALAVLESFRPRLILTDIELPGIDGLDLTRRLKSNPATREIIVLAITAYAMAGDEEKALRAGCSGYVTKPVDTRTLPATVKLHLESKEAARPAFEAGDYHDLLTDLRTSFLIEGGEEGDGLLRGLKHGFDADRAQRIAHRWAGIAGTLGFFEIVEKALGIANFLANPTEQNEQQASRIIAGGECVSRMRSELLSILQMFSAAIQGKRETPALPPAVWQVLSHKMFAVIGFEQAEAGRISRALAQARSLTHVFKDVPDTAALQPYHAIVVNVCREQSVSSWIHTGVFAVSEKPILFIGSAETLLRREPGIPERSCDFLLGPWDTDELVFRAYRLFSSNADRALAAPPAVRCEAPPVNIEHSFKMRIGP
jgi:two-component system cell cycle response regulator DivK